MIGYIILITIAIILSGVVYQQLSTYIPSDSLECPEGVSISTEEVTYDCEEKTLELTVKNNGRFDVAGYFISATTSPNESVATTSLSSYTEFGEGGVVLVDLFTGENNPLGPGEEALKVFNLNFAPFSQIYSIELLPARYQDVEGRNRITSCTDGRIKQKISCDLGCVPNTCSDLGYMCSTWDDGCGGILSCGTCNSGFFCDGSGQCIDSSCTPASDPCGSLNCGIVQNGTCGTASCGTCSGELYCDNPNGGQCVANCGNGNLDTGEDCDDANNNDGDGCSATCEIESGWTCSGQPSECTFVGGGASCINYCTSLGLGYTSSSCPANPGQCISQGGDYQSGGNQECIDSGAQGSSICCCFPAQ